MARRSTGRQQAALKSVDYISSQYAVRNEMRRKDIKQSSFEKREKSIDDMFAFATEALGVIDKISAKKKEDVKIEKSVTSMASKEGGEVSYKKPKIMDWLKGDSKFSEIGKESWKVGDTDYTRADMLAYDKFEMKNKWAGKVGEDMKTDTSFDAVKGEVVEKKTPGIKKEELSKAYSISGTTKDIEKEYFTDYKVFDTRLVEQKVSGSIIVDKNGLIEITNRGEKIVELTEFYRDLLADKYQK